MKGKTRGLAEAEVRAHALGIVSARQDSILAIGTDKYGKPSAKVLLQFNAISDPDRLVAIFERLREAESWKQLFADK